MQNASAAFFVNANFYADVLPPSAPTVRNANFHTDVRPPSTPIVREVNVDIRRYPEFESVGGRVEQATPPGCCELLMCLLVEPEFQGDRLADYQERFNDLWVPRFGRRGAVAIYVWHVLRQSRLIDWLIRAFGWGGPL